MNEEFEFQKWGSISRLFRPIVITEKIDGTNAQVNIIHEELVKDELDGVGRMSGEASRFTEESFVWGHGELGTFGIFAGSRKRYVNKQNDNYGFAAWVWDNADELTKLGPGRHYGEWWGPKIQRNYGLKERRFSLFNVMRYVLDPSLVPRCCHVVPLMYVGEFSDNQPLAALSRLRIGGSLAAPGFMNPEGVVVFHTHSKTLFKVTLEGDQHKGGYGSPQMEEKIKQLQRGCE
jgi:hypothetical protein